MKNRIKNYLSNKSGMTLVEVLTAMALISLLVFCFTPLFLTYLDTIVKAGDKIDDINIQSGTMQTVIGLADSIDSPRYSTAIGEVPLSLQANSGTTLSRKGVAGTILTTKSATLGNELSSFKGDLLFTNADNPNNSFITANGAGTASGLSYFPSSITDDFYIASITLVADGGIKFGTGLSYNDFKVTVSNVTGELGQNDYRIKRIDEEMAVLEFYGGGRVCFENSPLTIKYKSFECVIEIDAPMMIMVGEGVPESSNNAKLKYNYYVSRGEFDENGNLIIIQKDMNSTDPKNNNQPVKLTSAMNDVEWVPADSGDGYNGDDTNGDGVADTNRYGYYVMCGDNGQVRRFWRNNQTGNYYWGGDWTYYTDYNFVQINNQTGESPHIYSTDANGAKKDTVIENGKIKQDGRVYSTDTSFKFISQRSMSSNQSGFNVSSKEFTVSGSGVINTGTGLLRSLSVVSVTSAEDGEFYGNDGKIYFYKIREGNPNSVRLPTYSEMLDIDIGDKDYDKDDSFIGYSAYRINSISETAHGWLETNDNSFYEINGINNTSSINKNAYPITLTSVDAIKITKPNKTEVKNDGSYYFTTQGDGDTTAEGADTNLNYPQSSYTLYCGYIPAFMDLFATTTGNAHYKYPTSWKGTYAHSEVAGNFNQVGGNYLERAENRLTLQDNANHYAFWRMTLGLTPYYNNGNTTTEIGDGELAYYDGENTKEGGFLGIGATTVRWYNNVVYYPYKNIEYAITGKFFDLHTYNNYKDKLKVEFGEENTAKLANPNMLINTYQDVQTNVTNGEVVDITISYLSHPFAIAVAANPTDDVVYDLDNDKSGNNQVFYWNNRRETITFLDAASTVVPTVDATTKEPMDIPVSLMVGYVMGGTVDFAANEGLTQATDVTITVGSIMNNGIVFLRAGDYRVEKQNSANGQTYEYLAIDNGGYKLNKESNVFHQFYYLNSKALLEEEASKHTDANGNQLKSGAHDEFSHEPKKDKNIGNLYGANYWQNNRHIQQKSIMGGTASNGSDGSYEYLRSHPLTNTKVTCVAWGATWKGYPEAMWGTENGTVLSWDVDLEKAKSEKDYFWNDRSVDAEFQSYKWVDNANGKTYAVGGSEGHADSVGSSIWGGGKGSAGTSYNLGSGKVPDTFKYFCDKASQQTSAWNSIGFISTLETINDIAFANDTWVAVGDQSDKDPADYCSDGSYQNGGEIAKAFSGNGRGGSWVNVRYWVNTQGANAKQSDTNEYYHWRAVKISDNENYNIVQINNLNGMWVATGYNDENNNEEYDNNEDVVVCWTYNPLIPCGEAGGWSEDVSFYKFAEGTMKKLGVSEIGGINSCATRSED
ncbi:MAG: prepilin-type N-terminal cleavage/methylation domain-containing protein [Clostridia bacterium]|nr:prepilin-type N-terminal cleavage/methylation domain-containing protein [Clostridia bacterium]